MSQQESMTLLQLNKLIAKLMTVPQTQNVWVTAELSDVAVRGGHCYMELLQKDDNGVQQAKARGVIWANVYRSIASDFYAATGRQFATGLKLMVCASASMHPVYGMSLVITAVNPEYTLGDLQRRRMEILRRLKAEGVLELNRQLQWPETLLRIAVVSAPGAAGYGDFIDQLMRNQSHLRFRPQLFPAIMQGDRSPASIIDALDHINSEIDRWDCVVIIRGGGATSDLQAYEDYDLALNIAQFPIPVIIGIGHERDITVLDYVAKMRVKTPTAAAEFLINAGESQLEALRNLGTRILQAAGDMLSASKEQLGRLESLLPLAPTNALQRADQRLRAGVMSLQGISGRRISPALERLNLQCENLAAAAQRAITLRSERLDAYEKLVNALSPRAVLARGYSLTRINGHTVVSASQLVPGDVIETYLASGKVSSTVK
jgi:exodeoxyribonuclease VII large subunit